MRHASKILALLAASVAFGLTALAASASSGAHFMPDTSASVTGSGALSVYIDEAGVGNQTVNYTIAWTGTATYECINGGSNHPKATNKETVSSSGSTGASFSPINGRIEQTVPIANTPPGPGDFSCPSGQTLVLASVSYNPVVVTDTTNGVSITLKT